MKIRLNHRYRGALTNEQWLEAGVHELDTELATYLIDNGHAVAVAGAVPASEPEPVEDTVVTVSNEDSERESLIAEYEALTGDTPAWNIGLDTLKARLADLRESEG